MMAGVRVVPFLAALVVAFAVIGVDQAAAQFYRWVDEHGNAHFAEGIDNVPERYRNRAVPLGLRNVPAPPPSAAPVAKGPTVAAGGAQIPYRPGERILVDVRLNGRGSARLLLDTGADRTLISPRTLVAAGVELKRSVARGQMQGVTGTDEVIYVVVDSIEIGGARVDNLPVAAYEIGQREADGLLGRDVLDRFNLSIDASRGLVTLSPR